MGDDAAGESKLLREELEELREELEELREELDWWSIPLVSRLWRDVKFHVDLERRYWTRWVWIDLANR